MGVENCAKVRVPRAHLPPLVRRGSSAARHNRREFTEPPILFNPRGTRRSGAIYFRREYTIVRFSHFAEQQRVARREMRAFRRLFIFSAPGTFPIGVCTSSCNTFINSTRVCTCIYTRVHISCVVPRPDRIASRQLPRRNARGVRPRIDELSRRRRSIPRARGRFCHAWGRSSLRRTQIVNPVCRHRARQRYADRNQHFRRGLSGAISFARFVACGL